MSAVKHLLERLHATKFLGNIHVVGNIVAAVHTGRGIQRRKPDAVTAKGFDVIQLFAHTPQIAHTVTVAILKGAGPNLVEYDIFIPLCFFHKILPSRADTD